MTSVTTPEDRFHIETAAIEQAAAALSIEVLAVRPVSRGRTGVYLATTKSDGTTVGFPRGFDTTAVRRYLDSRTVLRLRGSNSHWFSISMIRVPLSQRHDTDIPWIRLTALTSVFGMS